MGNRGVRKILKVGGWKRTLLSRIFMACGIRWIHLVRSIYSQSLDAPPGNGKGESIYR